MAERVVFHVDANSAFLSWSAAYRVQVLGEELDLRTVPSVVAGDKESRHSIILAKSTPAKKFGISKSTVHKDISERLPQFNRQLYLQVKEVLDVNKAQRHIRGGIATRKKYRGT